MEVRNSFTDVISNFVRSGVDGNKTERNGIFSSFKTNAESFIKIGNDVKVEKDFRCVYPIDNLVR